MKKIVLFALCMLLCLSMAACDDKATSAIQSPNENNKLEVYNAKTLDTDNGLRFDHVENVDDEYYVYYFYLGKISQVPAYSSVAMQYNYDTEVTISFSSLTQESLTQTISKATEIIDTHSYTSGFQISLQEYIDAFYAGLSSEQSTDHHWTNNWGTTITESKTTTDSYIKEYGEGYSETVSFTKDAGFKKGNYYRISFYETVKAYGVLIYDVKKDIYTPASYAFMEKSSTVRTWEESADGIFAYESSDTIDFNVNAAIDYAKRNPPPKNKGDLPLGVAKTAYVDTKSLSCGLDNGYNYDNPDKNGNNYHYSHDFIMGQFIIEGGIYADKTVSLVQDNTISLGFRLEYDPSNLPLQDNMTDRYICKDGRFSNLYKMPWAVGEREVGYGILVALITYEDGTPSEKIYLENVFKDKKQGDIINIKSGIDKPCTVTISILYEVEMWAPGFLGIVDNYWMNWRINEEFVVSSIPLTSR